MTKAVQTIEITRAEFAAVVDADIIGHAESHSAPADIVKMLLIGILSGIMRRLWAPRGQLARSGRVSISELTFAIAEAKRLATSERANYLFERVGSPRHGRLGQELKRPPFLEPHRKDIGAVLPVLDEKVAWWRAISPSSIALSPRRAAASRNALDQRAARSFIAACMELLIPIAVAVTLCALALAAVSMLGKPRTIPMG
jgi:hypothetical protein